MHEDLTPTEHLVLPLLAQGECSATISATTGIRIGTVKVHATRIYKKLRVRNKTALVVSFYDDVPRPMLTVQHIAAYGRLAPLDHDVLHQLMMGQREYEVADALHTSPSAINSRITRIRELFDAPSTPVLVRLYLAARNALETAGRGTHSPATPRPLPTTPATAKGAPAPA